MYYYGDFEPTLKFSVNLMESARRCRKPSTQVKWNCEMR